MKHSMGCGAAASETPGSTATPYEAVLPVASSHRNRGTSSFDSAQAALPGDDIQTRVFACSTHTFPSHIMRYTMRDAAPTKTNQGNAT